MSFLKKPINIYRKELPKIGKQANPALVYEDGDEHFNMFQIITKGLLREEMSPKHYNKYDHFVYMFKVYLFTFIIAYSLFYAVWHSNYMSAPCTQKEMGDTWFDKMLDTCLNFITDQWEKIRNIKLLNNYGKSVYNIF